LIRKIITLTTILWVINEIIQATEIYNKLSVFGFFIIHFSSLYGAIIFCFLINHLKLNKSLMIVPIVIEIFQSWVSCRCIDYGDLIFSISGILIVFLILTLENNKLLK
jgi:hypothetical protein